MPARNAIARAQNSILTLLRDRAPNWVPAVIIKSRLREYDDATIERALIALTQSNRIRTSGNLDAGIEELEFGLTDYEGVQVRSFIRVGDADIPRVRGDRSLRQFPEYFNEAVERLAEYTAGVEGRFEQTLRKQLREYYATIVTLFGVFVAIIAFVIVGLPKITPGPAKEPWDVFVLNLAQVGPVAVVLALFIIVLRLVIR